MKAMAIFLLLAGTSTAHCKELKWNVVFKSSSENKKVAIIDGKITRVVNDMYCLSTGEPPSKSDESFFYKSMPRLFAECVYLKEHFQLYSFCDLKRNITISKQSLEFANFDVFLECSKK